VSNDDEWAAMRGRRRPTDAEWADAERRFSPGTLVSAVVLSHHPFGFFVDLSEPIVGLVEIPFAGDAGQVRSASDYPPVGTTIEAVVLHANPLQRQVRLTSRPSDLAAAKSSSRT
jgi:small subunit ribosomal protein S1